MSCLDYFFFSFLSFLVFSGFLGIQRCVVLGVFV